jgi:hypothetical protein
MRLASQSALDTKMRHHGERIVRASPWSKTPV